jgi:hypothetical protein
LFCIFLFVLCASLSLNCYSLATLAVLIPKASVLISNINEHNETTTVTAFYFFVLTVFIRIVTLKRL